VDLSTYSSPEGALDAALVECDQGNGDPVVALLSND
jgi:hypothetical protein